MVRLTWSLLATVISFVSTLIILFASTKVFNYSIIFSGSIFVLLWAGIPLLYIDQLYVKIYILELLQSKFYIKTSFNI